MPAHTIGSKLFDAATAGATSATVDTSNAGYAEVDGWITVVGTATVAASVTPQWSNDAGTNWTSAQPIGVGLAAGVYGFNVALPIGPILWRLVYAAQTGGTSSTCTAWIVMV